ncbi:MAG TPA: GAF domain-containing protein, partial [Magnetospirillaceae bacterium]|nr:GAF domain-containing protein [Magnetospirillaceae bacterium]
MPDGRTAPRRKSGAAHLSQTLLDVSNKLAVSDGLDSALKVMRDICTKLIGCERGSVFLHDDTTNELYARIEGRFAREIRILDSSGVAGDVFTKNVGAIVHDAYADPRFDASTDAQTGYRTRSMLCAPLRTKRGKVIGVAQLLNKVEGEFSEEDLSMLEAVMAQSSISLTHLSTIENIEKSRRQELDFLSVVSEISSELQLGPLLQKIMAAITRMLDAERCTLFINDPKSSELYSYVGQGLGSATIRLPNHMGIAGAVFTSGQTVN